MDCRLNVRPWRASSWRTWTPRSCFSCCSSPCWSWQSASRSTWRGSRVFSCGKNLMRKTHQKLSSHHRCQLMGQYVLADATVPAASACKAATERSPTTSIMLAKDMPTWGFELFNKVSLKYNRLQYLPIHAKFQPWTLQIFRELWSAEKKKGGRILEKVEKCWVEVGSLWENFERGCRVVTCFFLREVVVLWPGFTLRELWEILSCCDLVLLWENFERGCRVVTWFYFERTLRDTVVLWPGFALRELWERLSCCNLVLLWENFERGWTCVEGKCPKVLGLKTFKMVACWLSKWTSTTLSWLGHTLMVA